MSLYDYYVVWNGGAWMAKEGKYFEESGGLTETWGRGWLKVLDVSSSEHARDRARAQWGSKGERLTEEQREIWQVGRVRDRVSPKPTIPVATVVAAYVESNLTFSALQAASRDRTKRWHANGLTDWSPLEWSGAMCGENGEAWSALFELMELMALLGKVSQKAGEAANAAKKYSRVEHGMANINDGERQLDTVEKAKHAVMKELADMVVYAVLVAERVGGDLGEAVQEVFNKKSEEYGFPERI